MDHNYWACALEPRIRNYGSPRAQYSATQEGNARRSLHNWTNSCSATKTQHSQKWINKIDFLIWEEKYFKSNYVSLKTQWLPIIFKVKSKFPQWSTMPWEIWLCPPATTLSPNFLHSSLLHICFSGVPGTAPSEGSTHTLTSCETQLDHNPILCSSLFSNPLCFLWPLLSFIFPQKFTVPYILYICLLLFTG